MGKRKKWYRLGRSFSRKDSARGVVVLAFGIVIVALAWVLALATVGEPLGVSGIVQAHGQQPVLFIVDLLPLLGVAGYLYFAHKARRRVKELEREVLHGREMMGQNAAFAKALGEGDYDAPYEAQDEEDVLGQSLLRMRDNLVANTRKENEAGWIARCKDDISYVLRLHTNVQALGYEVLKRLIDMIDVVQGSLFLYDEESGLLQGLASYAYAREKYNKQTFRLGEGLIGQCAYERGVIYRTEIPEDYVTISSGILGDRKPASLLLIPLITDERLQGVLEFASIKPAFEPLEIRFLENVGETIARTLFNLRINAKTERLLHESQQMTQELRTNEELLRQNAEEMQVTHEELERSNAQLEAKIKEAENAQKRLHSLLENASEVITICDARGAISYISPSVTKILGYTPQEMMDGKDHERLTQEGQEMLRGMFNDLRVQPGIPRTIQYIFMKKDGAKVSLEVTGRNLLDDPAIQGIILNSQDITERLRAEKEERIKSKMQSLSENSLSMIIRLSMEGQFYYANPMVQRYMGLPPTALVNMMLDEVEIPQVLREALEVALREAGERNGRWEREVTVTAGDAQAILRLQAIPEYEEGVLETVLIVGHDITEERRIASEIQDKSRKITESINYAQRIQSSILPDGALIQQYLPKSFLFYRPRDVVSGDFPWFFVKDDALYIAAVDCTGHGVPGALLSFIGYFTLNNVVDHDSTYTAGRVLDLLHAGVRTTLRQDRAGADARDGMDIALCKICLREMRLEYAGAHRPLYLLHNGELTEYKGDRRAIGGIPNERKPEGGFTNYEIPIATGDRVFFFSDGLPDQLGGEGGLKKYSPQHVREVITKHSGLSMPKLAKFFSEDFAAHMGDGKQIDDVLLIGIEF